MHAHTLLSTLLISLGDHLHLTSAAATSGASSWWASLQFCHHENNIAAPAEEPDPCHKVGQMGVGGGARTGDARRVKISLLESTDWEKN